MKLRNRTVCGGIATRLRSRVRIKREPIDNALGTVNHSRAAVTGRRMPHRAAKNKIKVEPPDIEFGNYHFRVPLKPQPLRKSGGKRRNTRRQLKKQTSRLWPSKGKKLFLRVRKVEDPEEIYDIERNNNIRLIKTERSGTMWAVPYDHNIEATVPMPSVTNNNDVCAKAEQLQEVPNVGETDAAAVETVSGPSNTQSSPKIDMNGCAPAKDTAKTEPIYPVDEMNGVIDLLDSFDPVEPLPDIVDLNSDSDSDAIWEVISISSESSNNPVSIPEPAQIPATPDNTNADGLNNNANSAGPNNDNNSNGGTNGTSNPGRMSISSRILMMMEQGLCPPKPEIPDDYGSNILVAIPRAHHIIEKKRTIIPRPSYQSPDNFEERQLPEVKCGAIDSPASPEPQRRFHMSPEPQHSFHTNGNFTPVEDGEPVDESDSDSGADIKEYAAIVRKKLRESTEPPKFDSSDDDYDDDRSALGDDDRGGWYLTGSPYSNGFDNRDHTYSRISQTRNGKKTLKEFIRDAAQGQTREVETTVEEIFNNVCVAYLQDRCPAVRFCPHAHELPSTETVLDGLRKSSAQVASDALTNVMNFDKMWPTYFDVFAEYYGETKNRIQLDKMSRYCINPKYNLLGKLKSVVNAFVASGLQYASSVENLIGSCKEDMHPRDYSYLFDIIMDERNAHIGEHCNRFVDMFCSDDFNFVVEYTNRALSLCVAVKRDPMTCFCFLVLTRCTVTTFRCLDHELLQGFIEYVKQYEHIDQKNIVKPICNKIKQFHEEAVQGCVAKIEQDDAMEVSQDGF